MPPATCEILAQCHTAPVPRDLSCLCFALVAGSCLQESGSLCLCCSQWVLAFEIFIPLVLFFILLGLRQKKPTIPVKEGECQQGVWGSTHTWGPP